MPGEDAGPMSGVGP